MLVISVLNTQRYSCVLFWCDSICKHFLGQFYQKLISVSSSFTKNCPKKFSFAFSFLFFRLDYTCQRLCVFVSQRWGVDSYYDVCATPNTSSIFVYSPALFTQNWWARHTHWTHCFWQAHTCTRCVCALVCVLQSPLQWPFRCRWNSSFPPLPKCQHLLLSLLLRQAKLAAG